MRRAAGIALLAMALPCAAQDATPAPWEARAETARESLDHGQPAWREALLQLAWKPSRDLALVGGGRATERFDQRDREGFAAAYLPLGDRRVLHFEATGSGTHHVLPKDSVLAELAWPLGSGWVVSGSGKLARYAGGDVKIATGTVEKYFGDFRVGYTAYLSRPEGAGWAPAHRIAASWYRGDLTFVTLSGSRGREVENVYPLPLLVTDVRGASIAGGVEILPRWGLTFEFGRIRQGDLYTRRGARIGTRLLF